MKLSRSCTLSIYSSLLLATCASAASLTAVGVYDDDSCSGTPLQVVFSPTATDCSTRRPDSGCALEAKDIGLFATGNCTNDPRAFATATFGDSPYVFVEIYTPDTDCQSLEGVAAYRIDSACHRTVDAGTSFQVQWDDVSPSFKLFADGSCSSTPQLQFDLEVDSNECHGSSMKLYVMNTRS
ncbi:Elongation factor 1-alpha [Phytophthora megakarya]|uniref:Elongation factor 1-alpha n=1 Tax=Phytophthora megakarya TaxID=4795 RepID=A0A225WDA9_9STRA|nr:Elongation factor 1-alpha [Phytophthora megakarya]